MQSLQQLRYFSIIFKIFLGIYYVHPAKTPKSIEKTQEKS